MLIHSSLDSLAIFTGTTPFTSIHGADNHGTYVPSHWPTCATHAYLHIGCLCCARSYFAKGDTVLCDRTGRRFYPLSGVFNVLLYWYTRSYLLPHRVERQSMVLDAERADSQILTPHQLWFRRLRHGNQASRPSIRGSRDYTPPEWYLPDFPINGVPHS